MRCVMRRLVFRRANCSCARTNIFGASADKAPGRRCETERPGCRESVLNGFSRRDKLHESPTCGHGSEPKWGLVKLVLPAKPLLYAGGEGFFAAPAAFANCSRMFRQCVPCQKR